MCVCVGGVMRGGGGGGGEQGTAVVGGREVCWGVGGGGGGVRVKNKLQAQVYDILPSTAAVFSYAKGPRKLSANEQSFVGAQTVVSLLQTTQTISDFFSFFFNI